VAFEGFGEGEEVAELHAALHGLAGERGRDVGVVECPGERQARTRAFRRFAERGVALLGVEIAGVDERLDQVDLAVVEPVHQTQPVAMLP
jgi:hypothetical protein